MASPRYVVLCPVRDVLLHVTYTVRGVAGAHGVVQVDDGGDQRRRERPDATEVEQVPVTES